MKLIAFGTEPKGIIAIGQLATGVVAIGQLATGVIAIGQLARGVIVVGQLAVGVVAFGQASVALVYGGGMVGIVGLKATPSLVVWGVAGEAKLRRGGRWRPSAQWRGDWTAGRTVIRGLTLIAIAVVVWIVALSWLPDFFDEERVPHLPPFAPPGTR